MGAKTRLIYNNLWRKGGNALVSTPVADPQHPVSDTQIDTPSMYWKSSDKDIVTQYVPMDLKAGTRSINFIAILGHNIIEGEAGDITFEEADADTFVGPTPTSKFTWQANNMFKFLATPLTKQFVRLVLVNGGGFTTAPQVATILCGSYSELNRRFAPEYEIGEEDFSEMEYSDSQVLFAQEKDTLNIRHYSYQALNDASASVILAMFKECKTIKAFAVCLDHTAPNTNTLWVRNSELNPPVCRNGVWYWDMAIMEIV